MRTLKRGAPWALLTALAIGITWPVTFGGKTLYWGTIAYQFIPWYRAAAELWRSGHMPLWNFWVGGGAPLLANYQVAALYPPTWLTIVMPPERALGWLLAGHLLLTGCGMYAWARACGLSRSASLIGALALEGCGYLVTRAGIFPSIAFTFAWCPVWLWRAERLSQRPSPRNATRLAIVVGLGLLSGHAQTAAYGLIITVLWLAWRGYQNSTTARTQNSGSTKFWGLPIKCWFWGGVAFALGAGLAAAQLWPTAAYLKLTARSSGLSGEALIYSLWPWRALTFIAPDFFGHPAQGTYVGYPTYWEGAGYVGLIPLLLAFNALLHPPKNRRHSTYFWGAVGGAALLLSLGKFLPGYEAAFQSISLLRIFNAPARRLLVTEIALAMLAAQALTPWVEQRPERWQALPLLSGIVLTVTGGGIARIMPEFDTFANATLRSGVLLSAWGALALAREKLPAAYIKTGLILLLALDLGQWGYAQIPHIDASFYAACTAPQTAEAWQNSPTSGRILFAGNRTSGSEYTTRFEYFRTRDWQAPSGGWAQICDTLLPNLGALAGIPFSDNEDPFRLAHWDALETLAEQSPQLLPLLGVSHRLDTVCAEGEQKLAEPEGLALCYSGSAPRAWIVGQAQEVAPDHLLTALSEPSFDPQKTLLITGPAPLSSAGGTGKVTNLQDTANSTIISVTVDGPSYLILADAWAPGWTARYNQGEALPILQANLALRAVPIATAGEHQIVMRYQPVSQLGGLLCSGLSIFVLIWLNWNFKKQN